LGDLGFQTIQAVCGLSTHFFAKLKPQEKNARHKQTTADHENSQQPASDTEVVFHLNVLFHGDRELTRHIDFNHAPPHAHQLGGIIEGGHFSEKLRG
jgi:hypothetical protein